MTILLALRVLGRHRLRSALTTLGIVIGVGAMVAMVSLGQGATALVEAQIASVGTNVLIIIPGATTVSGVRTGLGGVSTLTVADAQELERRIPEIGMVSYATRAVLQAVRENRNWNTVVLGTTADFAELRNWPLARGTFFTRTDDNVAAKVAVLGKTVADNLFEAEEEIVGAQIRIRNVPFRVLGVMEPKGQSLLGQDQDDIIHIPFSTAQRKVFGAQFLGTVGVILVAAQRQNQIPAVVQEIKGILRTRHRLQPTEEDDFSIRTMEDIGQALAGVSETMTLMLLSIASISLLVGGIGIMNILLVSVTERTREIGIRMAVGAKRRHILLQFLIEAVILSLIGGAVGIVAGLVGARVVTTVMGWPAIVSVQAVGIALAFSMAVGIFFGLYPANKASRLSPIEALRYE